VFGCPVYVLQTTLQDAKKLPKWQKKSWQGIFVRFGKLHGVTYVLLCEDALNIFDDNGQLLEEIKDYYNVGDDNIQLYTKFVGQEQPVRVDY
jgi:hypothetical protein